jgi:hypothetical protein
VSIAQQIATPTPTAHTRAPRAPFRPAPPARRGYALVRIAGLIALTALGVSLIAGTIAIAMMVFASSVGG